MADGFELTTDDGGLSAFLGSVTPRVVAGAHKLVTRGAVNIKTSMREDVRESRSFRRIEPHIDFDQVGLSAEIGPNKRGAGNLAHFAYFGGANGGGGTVRDPQRAAEEEAPRFERALDELMGDLFG